MIVDPLSSRSSMAKDHDHDEHLRPTQEPPSYHSVVNGHSNGVAVPPQHGIVPSNDVKVPTLHSTRYPHPDPSTQTPPGPYPSATVYHYVDYRTGERIVSLLPPNHPEMICLQAGGHATTSRYGLLGVLAAIIWFPLGIGLCLLDRRVYCKRCGVVLEDGMC